jgi:hypothetical protein
MAEKQSKMTNDQPKASGKSWADVVGQTKEQQEIYPKLDFGPKGQETTFVVEFLEQEPRVIKFEDKMADRDEWINGKPPVVNGFAINVKVVGTQERRSILMRDDPNHGLVRGIGGLVKANGGKLLGVHARIEATNYTHKQWGKNTRGYAVYQVDASAANDLPR